MLLGLIDEIVSRLDLAVSCRCGIIVQVVSNFSEEQLESRGGDLTSKTRSLWGVLLLFSVWLAIAGQWQLETHGYILDGVFFLAIASVLFLLAVSRGLVEEPALWPHSDVIRQDAELAALTRGRLRWLLLVTVVALSAIAFVSLTRNRFTLHGVLCWWGAILAWLLAIVYVSPYHLAWRVPDRAALRRIACKGGLITRSDWVMLVLLCILVAAFLFRIYRIDMLPQEAGSDQVEASLDVWDILHGQYRIFFPRNTGREATQFYLTAALSHVFGYSLFTLKLTMALIGILNIIPMYFLGKELLDRHFGLLTAFFMAFSYWHVAISRIGLRIVLAPFWTAVTLCFILRAFRTGRRNDYLLTGLWLGLGLYGYMAFRVVPLLMVILCLLKATLDRGPHFHLGRFISNVGLLVITSILVFLPMLRYMYDEPRMFWHRVLTRTTNLEIPIQQNKPLIFLDNVKRALLMFNWAGDTVFAFNVPLRPVLDHISAGLFVLGAAYVCYLLLAKRRAVALYLIVAVFVLLLPSTLALAFPHENPSNIRASAVIPVMVVLISLPVYLVGRQVAYALRGGAGVFLVVVLGAVLLWQVARLNLHIYFSDYEQSYSRATWNNSDMARVIRGFGDSVGNVYDAYIICTPYWVDHRAVALELKDMDWDNLLVDLSQAQLHLAEPRNHLYIFNPVNSEAEHWLQEHYPSGQLMRFQASIPGKDFMIYFAPAQL